MDKTPFTEDQIEFLKGLFTEPISAIAVIGRAKYYGRKDLIIESTIKDFKAGNIDRFQAIKSLKALLDCPLKEAVQIFDDTFTT